MPQFPQLSSNNPLEISITNLQKYDKQEILDYIACKLLQQNEKFLGSHNSCYYHSEKYGKILKCAIGHIIPDTIYTGYMEGLGLRALNSEYNLDIEETKLLFLRELQMIHDYRISLDWYSALTNLAVLHKLEINFDQQGNYTAN